MSIVIRLLGTPEVTRDGALVRIPRKKTRAVLFVLASTAARTPREQLAGLLWPELPADRGLRALRGAIFELRTLLGRAHLDEGERGLGVSAVDVDVLTFEAACAALEQGVPSAPGAELERVARGVAAHGGAFLQGFELEERPFATWKAARARALDEALGAAVERLVGALEARGAHAEALVHARRYAAQRAEDERAHQHVIRLLGALGRAGEAYQQYEECRRALQAAYGVEPAVETRRLIRGLTEARLRAWSDEAAPMEAAPLPSISPARAIAAEPQAPSPSSAPSPAAPPEVEPELRVAPRRWLDAHVERAVAVLEGEGVVALVGPPGSGVRAVFARVVAHAVGATASHAEAPLALDPDGDEATTLAALASAAASGRRAIACLTRVPHAAPASIVRVEPPARAEALAFLVERARLRGARIDDDATTWADLEALLDTVGTWPGMVSEVASRAARSGLGATRASLASAPLTHVHALWAGATSDERAAITLLAELHGPIEPALARTLVGDDRALDALTRLGVLHGSAGALWLEPAARLAARLEPTPAWASARFEALTLERFEDSAPEDLARAIRTSLAGEHHAALLRVVDAWIFDAPPPPPRLPLDALLDEATRALDGRRGGQPLLGRVRLLQAIRASRAGLRGAIRAFREAHALLSALDDRRGLVELDLAYAEEARAKGWLGPAEVSLGAAERWASALEDPALVARVAVARARHAAETRTGDEVDLALRHALSALRRAAPTQLDAGWLELGRVLLRRGASSRAAAVLRDALASFEGRGAARAAGEARLLLAEALLAELQGAAAEAALAPLRAEGVAPDLAARARRLDAHVALTRGADDDAERMMVEAALSLQALGHLAAAATALAGLADARARRGDLALARVSWSAAARVAQAAGAHGLRRRVVEQLVASLPTGDPLRDVALEQLTPTISASALDTLQHRVVAYALAERGTEPSPRLVP